MAAVWTPPFFLFLLALSAFVLLVLVTFSTPFIQTFYFLQASVDGGVIFGPWGWCSLVDGSCSPEMFGYHWDPQIVPVLTKLNILYPISAFFTLVTGLCLLPILCNNEYYWYPYPWLAVFAMLAFLTSAAALGASTAVWVIALNRFHNVGIDANISGGACIWMSTGATIALLLLMLNTAYGTFCWGIAGRISHRVAYTL